MSKKSQIFLKIFLPLLVVIATAHFCVVRLLSPAEEKNEDPANNALVTPPPPSPAGNVETVSVKDTAAASGRDSGNSGAVSAEKITPYDYTGQYKLPPLLEKLSRRCKSGVIVDLNSRKVLWSRNANTRVPVASLTKLMTAKLIMEDIAGNRFQLATVVPVTKAATSVERSCVLGMKRGESYSIEELIAAMMINSHNDAAAQLAAIAAGNVNVFVQRMNDRAARLGLTSAKFNSPNGLPQGKTRQNSLCSVNDITMLCESLMQYPDLMAFCRMRNKKLHTGKVVYSHNHLLTGRRKSPPVPGLFGFKTGYTNRAGFCLAFGVERDGRKIIGTVAGFPSSRERDDFCRAIIDWSFKQK